MCSLLTTTAWDAQSAYAAPIDYNRDVRPILSENCFACHGFDEASRKADLRLDVAESALAVISPADPQASELWRRVTSDDRSEQMPPPESHHELKDAQKETLRAWIEQGAPYADHWAFIPPSRVKPPGVPDEAWPRNTIDRFVAARLHAEGLAPSPEAGRRMLVRRVSFDLTGMPPTAEEVDSFVNDRSPDAYEGLVDRLLASPHFGERMALAWLDASRYADTNGFSIDGGRHIWLWRDWVIHAFNQNMPYDRFLIEQLAGDLLPQPTDAQRIATGFQRNNMVTHEGGTIPEENLTNYNADRVKTLGEAVLGLTLGCAQCHDHKYDPITQREYFQVFAYFNTIGDIGLDGDGGINPRPYFEARTVLPPDGLEEIRARIASLRHELDKPSAGAVDSWVQQQREVLLERGKDFAIHPAKLLKISTPNKGTGFDIVDDRYVVISQPPGFAAYDVSMKLPDTGKPITGLRVVFYPNGARPSGGQTSGRWGFGTVAGHDGQNRFMLTALAASADAVPGDQVDLHHLLRARRVTASSWLEGYRPENVLDARPLNGWSPQLTPELPVHVTLSLADPIDAAQTPYLTAQTNFGHGRSLVASKFEFYAVTGEDADSDLPGDIIAMIESPDAVASPEQRRRLARYYADHADATRAQRIDLANLEERVRVMTEKFPTMVMVESASPRVTRVLNRGNYADPGEAVKPGVPGVLPPLPAESPANRLGLAQWLTMPSHPLTARVAVNRVWQQFFGSGLVRTAADFGAQGAWPTHPELLDWLAVAFVESGWDTKAMVRQIVTSATYRQSSATGEGTVDAGSRADLLRIDPENQLLARGPRFRLSAESIRDSALCVSGLLAPEIGGPSVNPYTPGDLWREVSHYGSTPATAQTFAQDHGEKLYRRSLYTYWKRTVPPPNMAAFDAPTRETCVVERAATTTPLQALVMLNDVQFVEASRAFAERILRSSDLYSERLRWAFEECLSRPPTEAEVRVLSETLRRERARYAGDPEAALTYLTSGESPRDASFAPGELAAWSQVATVLLNLSETITRN